jgi:hypothetical protein
VAHVTGAVVVGLALGYAVPLGSGGEPTTSGLATRVGGLATSPAPPVTRPGAAPLQATFARETTRDGRVVGPLVVRDPAAGEVVWRAPGRVLRSDADDLARTHGWTLVIE